MWRRRILWKCCRCKCLVPSDWHTALSISRSNGLLMFRQLTQNNVRKKCVQTVSDRLAASSADESFGKPVQITGPRRTRRAPTVRLCCMCFVFINSIVLCPLYKLTLSAQAEVILQLRGSLSSLVKRRLVGLPLLVATNTLSVAVAPINQVTAS